MGNSGGDLRWLSGARSCLPGTMGVTNKVNYNQKLTNDVCKTFETIWNKVVTKSTHKRVILPLVSTQWFVEFQTPSVTQW